jgi:hypothetical protein
MGYPVSWRRGSAMAGDRLLPSFFIIGAPGGIGALWAVAGATPVPLAAIAEENTPPLCFLNPELDSIPEAGPHVNLPSESKKWSNLIYYWRNFLARGGDRHAYS